MSGPGQTSARTSDVGAVGPSAAEPLSDIAAADAGVAWAMVESTPDALVVVDEFGTIDLVNRQTEILFGYDRGDLLGRPVEMLLPERLAQVHTAHRTRFRAAPDVRAMGSGMDLLARRADGTEFPVEISLSPLRDDTGLRIIAAIRDISERVSADARGEEVRRLLDAVEDGVFMFDTASLRFTYVNEGAVRQVGYSRVELADMTPLHLKPEYTEAEFREMLLPLLGGDVDSVRFETVHRRRDGRDLPVEIVVQSPGSGGSSVTRSCVALVRDITDRRRHEIELSEVKRQAALVEDRDRIARDMHDTVIGRLFGAGMALQGTLGVIDDVEISRRVDDVIDQIDEAIREIRTTVYGLPSRLDWGQGVRGQILAIASDQRAALGFEPAVELVGPIDDLPHAVSDALLATLRESLANVVKHADASRVEIEVEIDAIRARLTVIDDGVGFDPAALSGDPAALTGHGVQNMQERAVALGGEFHVSSSRGTGTQLEWRVPLSPAR